MFFTKQLVVNLVVALQLWEESQMENERLRERLRGTNEELGKCKDQLDNAFQLVRCCVRPTVLSIHSSVPCDR